MNPVERVLDGELMGLLDRLAGSLPEGLLPSVAESNPTLRSRLDEVDTHLGDVRAALLADYARWQRALEDVENLWALASWRTMNLGGPDMAPQTPQRSERPGEPVALLDTPDTEHRGGPDMAPQTPQRSERPGEPVALLDCPDTASATEEPLEQAATLAA